LEILKQAREIAGAKTYSETVNLALLEFVRQGRFIRILELQGQGIWQGDLSSMRADDFRK
jgi:hypothetical protein